MDKFLVTFGYHENERKFGQLVRNAYLEKFGEQENVLFHEIKAERNILGGEMSIANSDEITDVQKEYQPLLTIDIHHTYLEENFDPSSNIETKTFFCLDDTKLTNEWELIWLNRIYFNKEINCLTYRAKVLAHPSLYPHNLFQIEAEIKQVNEENVLNTVEVIDSIFSSYCDFNKKINEDKEFQRGVEVSNKNRIEDMEKTLEKIKQIREEPASQLISLSELIESCGLDNAN